MAAPYLPKYSNQTDLLRAVQEQGWLSRRNINPDTRWYGKKAVQDATHWSDATTLTPFRCISGAGVYGTDLNDEAQVFGTDDLLWSDPRTLEDPASGMFKEMLFIANSANTLYRFRIVYGTSEQSLVQAIAAGKWTETTFFRGAADNTRVTRDLRSRRLPIDCQIWAQCANATDNATLDFLVGVHYYEYQTPYHVTSLTRVIDE